MARVRSSIPARRAHPLTWLRIDGRHRFATHQYPGSVGSVIAIGALIVALCAFPACEGCDDGPAPSGTASGASTVTEGAGGTEGQDEDSPEEEYVPVRPTFVHEAPPTRENVELKQVDGPWIGLRGNLARTGVRETAEIREPRVIWSIQIGVQGYNNTPIVTHDTIYVSSQGHTYRQTPGDLDDGDGVYALEPATGAIRWHVQTDSDAHGMTLDGDYLFTVTRAGTVYAIDRNRGDVVWARSNNCSLHGAPIVHDGHLHVPNGGGMIRYNRESGEPVGDVPDCVHGTRDGMSVADDYIYVAATRQPLEVYRGAQLRWRADGGAIEDNQDGWQPAVISGDLVFITYRRWRFDDSRQARPAIVAMWRDNGQIAYVIDLEDPSKATEVSSYPAPFQVTMPWIVGDRVYATPITRGAIVSYDILTGEEVEVIPLPDCRRRQFASLVGTPAVGYFARHDGVLYGFSLQPFRVIWRIHLGMHALAGTTTTHVHVTGGCSELPTDGTALFSTPAIGPDGTLYVGSGDGWLYAIRDRSWPPVAGAPTGEPDEAVGDDGASAGDGDGAGEGEPVPAAE